LYGGAEGLESGGGHDLAFFWRRGNFGLIAKKDAEFARIEECVFERTISTQPKMLDGMGIRRFLLGAVGFVKAEQLALPIVKRCVASEIGA
jgi:hypothetical protein